MTEGQVPEKTKSGMATPFNITLIMVVVTLFGPSFVQIQWDPSYYYFQLLAMTYMMSPYYVMTVVNMPLLIVEFLPLTFVRLVFTFMMYRLYSKKTTIKRAMLTGVAAELEIVVPMYALYLPYAFLDPFMLTFLPVLLPIPDLLIVGLLLIRFAPPDLPDSWIESESTRNWWERKPKETSVDMPPQKPAQKPPQKPSVTVQEEATPKKDDEEVWMD
jgi:hypothetical protein